MNAHLSACSSLSRFLVFWISTLLSVTAWSASIVKEVRFSNQTDSTRVVVELTEVAQQKVFTLDNPTRVVIDLADTSLAGKLPLGEGTVKNLRVAKRDNGDLRIVLDLTQVMELRSSWLQADNVSGPRLVLDLSQSAVSTDSASNDTSARIPAAVPPAPAETAPMPVKSMGSLANGRDLVIAVDAGHGGEDPGAIGRRGVQEKNVTLAIARLLKERIDAEPGMRAVLTRDADYFVPLRERINRARQHQADMFVSIHADSVKDVRASGASVYTLSPKGATSEAARWLADRENAADMVGGVSLDGKNGVLASVLLDLSQGATMGASMDAAGRVLRQLDRLGNTHHSGVQQAGFVVLKSPDIPSMLVETAFISNPLEEARLSDPQHQNRIADAVLAGVRDYFYTNTPPGTRVAQIKATRQARLD
ncbi:MAG: N-acetylmuramoyl-L-alanine amidase [Steroidobacteraceae bacterium]